MSTRLEYHLELVKSRLLPLSLLERVLEWFVERLPRRLIRVELRLNNDLAIINESRGEYKATGFAPCFEMKFTPSSPLGGWYYLEAALVRNNGSREACIRADFRSESNKSITIPIPTNLRGTVREVLHLPSDVATLLWLPTAAPGFFSQSQLLVHKITPLESTLRRLHRVLFDLWRFRARAAVTRGGLSWWAAISDLDEAYQRTAALRIKRLMGNDYPSFIAIHDTLKKSEVAAMRRQASQMPQRPAISLIMSVQSPIKGYLREALNSVCGQIYPHWELLLVGDFSTDTQCLAIANEYQSKDARVKIIPVVFGAAITAALNGALAVAQGEFIARIGQYDQIPPHALLFLVHEVCNYPDAELIYADSDSIDEAGKRHDPRFKPDWNPDLFYSHNYLGKPTFYRLVRVKELGGYRPGFDGEEDYDLSLRYLRDIPAVGIKHIAKILIHCRTDSQFPLEGEHGSGKRALTAYFEGSGIAVEDSASSGLYRIKHCLPAQPPLVSIIVPTRDRVDILKNCIESIQEKTDYENWEIIVVDNQSVEFETLAYFDQIKTSSRIKIIHYEKSFNFSALNNFAVQFAQGEVLALLNNDVEVI
jgi:glycosyltransferase involved in cell wall biosynthesis